AGLLPRVVREGQHRFDRPLIVVEGRVTADGVPDGIGAAAAAGGAARALDDLLGDALLTVVFEVVVGIGADLAVREVVDGGPRRLVRRHPGHERQRPALFTFDVLSPGQRSSPMEGVSRSEEKVLAGLTDEELVVLDRQEGAHRGWAELERRYARWRAGLVARLARRWRLPPAGVPDAQQHAALATREALARYDLARTGPPNGCRFRTFLGRTVMARFQDYCRNHRRQESHLDRSPEVVAALEAGAELGDNRAGRGPGDPVRTAEL